MGGLGLDKQNLKEILEVLKRRYGDLEISKIEQKIWDDNKLVDVILYHQLFFGKRIKIREKSDGFIKKNFLSRTKDKRI